MNNANTTLKFRKQFAGEYVAEFTYKGQPAKVKISAMYPGWSWSAYLNGQYVTGDGANEYLLKDFKNKDAEYFFG